MAQAESTMGRGFVPLLLSSFFLFFAEGRLVVRA
jgi:hypothetical protein